MSRVYPAHEEALGRDVVVTALSPELAQEREEELQRRYSAVIRAALAGAIAPATS